ncbi:NUDIX domain-containing protein [Antrihabitans sp. YC3-6]|uniref:NUDIX domain-containing protein n=1 Tax=Antrihabitans stalagmiti TaxID=2799499 RepID=A0A934U471_9NOCA|nr:NUDIX domain-containing protein [Antrihabitans stalagmiti]MBJ8340112.1 NUDIX domain-containing protein [Antrihabitans stalagmiti]
MTLSSGVMLYRVDADGEIRVLIAHMGGPFWARKDEHAWSIPKGEYVDEEPEVAAVREFLEEMGSPVPDGELVDLGQFRQSSGKKITAFVLEADFDAAAIVSNTFELEWPPKSGRMQSFPEIDRAAWFDVPTARTKLVKGQIPILDRLVEYVGSRAGDANQSSPNQ